MPKSKRAKAITLSKVKKKGSALRTKIIQAVQDSYDSFSSICVVEIKNLRTVHLQDLRSQLGSSRLLCGKKKVMLKALQTLPHTVHNSESFRKFCCMLSQSSGGTRGLLFTNLHSKDLTRLFSKLKCEEYARSGFISTKTVILQAGAQVFSQFQHTLEPRLRELGLPTTLKNGKIHLIGDTTVCTEGSPLTTESAQILKLLGIKSSQFEIKLLGSWDKENLTCVELSNHTM